VVHANAGSLRSAKLHTYDFPFSSTTRVSWLLSSNASSSSNPSKPPKCPETSAPLKRRGRSKFQLVGELSLFPRVHKSACPGR
jgi:hypothetical protein